MKRNLFKSALVCFFTFFAKSNSAKATDWGYGVDYKMSIVGYNIDAFVSYKINDYISFASGLGYKTDIFALEFKNSSSSNTPDITELLKNLEKKYNNKIKESDYENVLHDIESIINHSKELDLKFFGQYNSKSISLPLIVGLHPFGGNFRIYLGVIVDFLLELSGASFMSILSDKKNIGKVLDLSKNTKKPKDLSISEASKELEKTEEIKFDKESEIYKKYVSPVKLSLVYGMDHTFFFGLKLGFEITRNITDFIKFEDKYDYTFMSNYTIRGVVGLDIAKIIDLFTN